MLAKVEDTWYKGGLPQHVARGDIGDSQWKVLRDLPPPMSFKAGELFKTYPWGEVFVQVQGRGPAARRGDLQDWLKDGSIELISGPFTPKQEGAKS